MRKKVETVDEYSVDYIDPISGASRTKTFNNFEDAKEFAADVGYETLWCSDEYHEIDGRLCGGAIRHRRFEIGSDTAN